jgi:ribosomal protein L37AE/L43A
MNEDWDLADLLVKRSVFWVCVCGRTQADLVKTKVRQCRACGLRVRVDVHPPQLEPLETVRDRIREKVRSYAPGK